MHTNKVLHRDLKTQNVFMLGNGRLVLGDLGISKVLNSFCASRLHLYCHTVLYFAFEITLTQTFSFSGS
jgi:serine/threonine protein kinase